MRITPLALDGLLLIEPTPISDARGVFCEIFRHDLFTQAAGPWAFVQGNLSRSTRAGTVRGLHMQAGANPQGKLVRCAAGAIFDVAVDARPGSKTLGQHVAVELSAANGQQLWIPPGFLHGLATLTDGTEVHYKVTAPYSPADEIAVRWNDPDLGIDWPMSAETVILSARDVAAPWWREVAGQL